MSEEVYGPIFKACRHMPCILRSHPDHDCWGYVTGHHVKRVGAGGKDENNVVPVCVHLHNLVHGQVWGTTERDIVRDYDLDLQALAIETTRKILESDFNMDMDLDF